MGCSYKVATRWLGGEGGSMVSFSFEREGVNDDKPSSRRVAVTCIGG